VVIIHNAITKDDPRCDSPMCALDILSFLLSGVGAFALAHGLELLLVGVKTELFILAATHRKKIRCFRSLVFSSSSTSWWEIGFLGRYTLDVWTPLDGVDEYSALRDESHHLMHDITVSITCYRCDVMSVLISSRLTHTYQIKTNFQHLRPVVVFVHGGMYRFGSKNMARNVGYAWSKAGMVTVLPNYRLAPWSKWPAQVDDVADAVRWVFDNIDRYGGDPANVYLVGHSAGAHAVADLALHPRRLADRVCDISVLCNPLLLTFMKGY